MIRAASLWALLAAACGELAAESADVTAADGAALARTPVLRVGDRHVYELAWHAEATRTSASAGVSGALTLEGDLAVSVLSAGPEGTRLSLSLLRVGAAELRVQTEPVAIDPAMLTGLRAEILVGSDGDVRRAFFDPDSPPIFRELMTGVIARLDLRGAEPDAAAREIRSGHGLVEATYHAVSKNVITRELRRVVRFDTAPGITVDASALLAEGRIELDDDRVPVVIELHDGATLPGEQGLVADDRFSLVRTRVDRAPAHALVEPIEIDPNAGPDLEASAREMDRQYAAGYQMQDLSIALTVASGGLQPSTGEFSRAAAFLRAWPEHAEQLVPMIAAADEGGRQLAFDMLSAAGTPQAQAAMREVMSLPQWASWPERVVLVQRFAFVAEPTVASAELLLSMLDEAALGGDHELCRATMHPLGVVASRVDDLWLAERIHSRLVAFADDDDAFMRAGAIAGLGNARRLDDVPRLLVAMGDDDSSVRVEAASAMRFWVMPNTTTALLDALADENPAVGSVALDVLRKRHFEGEADPALAERARDGRYNPQIENAVASSLVDHSDRPEVLAALAAIESRTPNRRLARRLAEL